MKINRIKIMAEIMILLILCLGIIISISGNRKTGTASNSEEEFEDTESREESTEKAYDLPVTKKEQDDAETDCLQAMENIRSVLESSSQASGNGSIEISEKQAKEIQDILSASGNPVSYWPNELNMSNYNKMELFLKKCEQGEKGKIVAYEICTNGGIRRNCFIYNGNEMQVLSCNALWNADNHKAVIVAVTNKKIKTWKYTKKGWFCYELCVPEEPQVTEVVNGNKMLRVLPIKEEYQEIVRNALLPIGYMGNNLFDSDWDADHMEKLDYNGLFKYFYNMEDNQKFDRSKFAEGIPKAMFEDLMMKYLPVTKEELQQFASYDKEKECYLWQPLGCGNYSPNDFGTSFSEITNITKKEDGTQTLTIDGVCEAAGNDAIITHELTVRFLDNGQVQYLSNKVLDKRRIAWNCGKQLYYL